MIRLRAAASAQDPRLSTGRLDAFSDGVMAIAITLLILDVAAGTGDSPLDRLFAGWPSYLGYLVSFLTIGNAWLAHAHLTHGLTSTDLNLLRLNLFFLLSVVSLPFSTRLVTEAFGDAPAERVAITLYGATLLSIRLLIALMDSYARRAGLREESDDTTRRTYSAGIVLDVIALAAGLVLPAVAISIYFGVALLVALPSRRR